MPAYPLLRRLPALTVAVLAFPALAQHAHEHAEPAGAPAHASPTRGSA